MVNPIKPSTLYDGTEEFYRTLKETRLADVFRFISFIPKETYGPHTHQRIEINYVKKGSAALHLENGNLMRFKEKELMVITPNVPHKFEAGPSGATLMQLEFLPDMFIRSASLIKPETQKEQPSAETLLTEGNGVIRITDNPSITATIQNIIDELRAKRNYYRFMVISHYMELLIQIFRHMRDNYIPEGTNPALQKAVRYIQLNYQSPVSSADIAAHAGISERYLRKMFALRLNSSPIEYLNRLRIEKAMRLLENTGLSVKEISFRCGFNSPQYFSRVFRQHTGSLPRTKR